MDSTRFKKWLPSKTAPGHPEGIGRGPAVNDPGLTTVLGDVSRTKTGCDDNCVAEIHADLFSPRFSKMALAHCISADIAMGKGIAKIFKERFGGVDELRRQSLAVGQVGVLLRDGRCIFYMVTKARYFHKPARADFSAALAALAAACRERAVAQLAMPRIGCGLDGLDWGWVSAQVRAAFAAHPTVASVTVCSI